MLMAAKGNASFSGMIAATPKPCPAAPIPNPRLTGSSIPRASNIPLPTVAPKIPVSTTTLAAIAIFPSRICVMTMAKPVVTLRESNERRIIVFDPMFKRRTYHAVPKRPPILEHKQAASTTRRLSAMIFLRLYIGTARHPTAGPNKKSNKSPAPVFDGDKLPALYVLNTSSKLEPVRSESNFVNRSVPAVLVTSGWTTFVKPDGSLAPKT
mmetsp:Transcript_7983/g.12384  ORF Transcript_7983/g.12384 Transcript_7983/m.12384 type:complete len:210 (-) Transcript_7983:264-893(-)